MSNNSGRTNQLAAPRRGKLGTIWWEIIWPGLIITCIGLASLLFLVSCARVSELELQVSSLQHQIDKQMAAQRQLGQRVAELRDRTRLREFVADSDDMVLAPVVSDYVQLPALPAEQWTISALTPQPETLVSRLEPARPEPLSLAHRAGVANTF